MIAASDVPVPHEWLLAGLTGPGWVPANVWRD